MLIHDSEIKALQNVYQCPIECRKIKSNKALFESITERNFFQSINGRKPFMMNEKKMSMKDKESRFLYND